jgi:hypothetical protein
VTCDNGCALITVPFGAVGQTARYVFGVSPVANVTDATKLAASIVAPGETTGRVRLIALNGADMCFTPWTDLSSSAGGAWTTIGGNLSCAKVSLAATQIGIEILGGATADTLNPSVSIYLRSLDVTNPIRSFTIPTVDFVSETAPAANVLGPIDVYDDTIVFVGR